MSKSLQSVLGFAPLTASLRATASGVPNPFPEEFFQVDDKNRIYGDRAQYIQVTGERRTGKLAKYGSAARRRTLRDVANVPVRMMHINENFAVDVLAMQQLMAFEQWVQDKGMDWLNYELEEASRRLQNSRIITAASALRYGAIYWDSDGNLLPSSSGQAETYSFNVPATHQNQCNGNISGSWVNHTQDIPGDLRNLKQFAAQETGLAEGWTALYGKNIVRYITQNSFSVPFMARAGDQRDQFVSTGEMPANFSGIAKWIPVYTSFFEQTTSGADLTGSGASITNSTIWGDDLLVLYPPVVQPDKMGWYAMYEGSYQVPKSIEVKMSGLDALSNFETVYGMFSYATVTLDPPGILIYHGDTWLPGIKNPKALFQATVAF